VELKNAQATGPEGLITRRDVERIATQGSAARRANAMAALTTKSVQTIPQFQVTAELDASCIVRRREEWNLNHPSMPASVNDFLVRAACAALLQSPELNAVYRDGKIERRSSANVLLVVASDAGLMLVPLADPTRLPWEEYLLNVKSVIQQARENRQTATPLMDEAPALAISNLGMFGIQQFTAIIPPSASAVLAIPAIREQPVVRNHRVEIGHVCAVTLCVDHRVIDGVMAAQFLQSMQAQVDSL
jgi:pyruvate dehydrogenase E2 component (dihydrolipoamide acetyltransferase)